MRDPLACQSACKNMLACRGLRVGPSKLRNLPLPSCREFQKLNILKTTPTPNKNGSYGVKSGFVCHKSRSSYAIKVGSCTTFSVKVPLFQGIFTAYDPSFYGIFWGHIFANWGGGVVKLVFNNQPMSEIVTSSEVPKRGRSKCGRTQKHANEPKISQMSANESSQKTAKECKRARKSSKGAQTSTKNCKQTGLKQPGLGTPKHYVTPRVLPCTTSMLGIT